MTASEVATVVAHTMVASEATRVATQAPVNWSNPAWFAIVGTVCGALIAAGATLLSQHLTWKREQAKLAAQRAPAQLDAAVMLEAFGRRAAAHLEAVKERIVECLAEQHGETAPTRSGWTELAFDASLIGDRAALPIEILSPCLELPTLLAESRVWIDAVSHEEWPSPLDLYQLDAQRAVLYGLVASELANQLRIRIKAPASSLATDCFERFKSEFENLKNLYVSSQGSVELIPDLKARLSVELPGVMVASNPVLASARR
ncbi:hypothetical protein [Burkholderia anthina]|uniref:hypothetical protein n=1 Tax=Burkholderia anthina TaxID=179879 RepID=UPI0037C0AD4E